MLSWGNNATKRRGFLVVYSVFAFRYESSEVIFGIALLVLFGELGEVSENVPH